MRRLYPYAEYRVEATLLSLAIPDPIGRIGGVEDIIDHTLVFWRPIGVNRTLGLGKRATATDGHRGGLCH